MRSSVLVVMVGCGRIGFDASPTLADGAAVDGAVASALVVDFRFEDSATGMYVDLAGGPAATCSTPNCPTFAAGHHGQGLLFDGTDDCLVIPDSFGRLSSPTITLAIWAHQDSYSPTNDSQFSKRLVLSALQLNSWQLEDYNDGSFAFTSNAGTATNDQLLTPGALVKLGAWQHIAISWDGSIKRVYVDGALATMSAQPAIAYDSSPARIGCDDNGGIAEVFHGTLDEFQVYSRALDPAEILALSQS